MKRIFSLALTMALCMGILAGCGSTSGNSSASSAASSGSASSQASDGGTGIAKKACLITSQALGNDFTDLIWSGIQQLEDEGWEVKCIETTESGEYADQIRSMASEGYVVMFTLQDDVSNVAVELADELAQSYPKLHIFLLDTYMEQDKPNCTSIAVDVFESSFIAGYIAAATTQVGTVGWIGHTDMFKITRFRDGFIAGVEYYNKVKNKDIQYVSAFTGDWNDPVKGYETGISMIETYGVDVIYQCDYNGGPGVIKACAEKGIKCIGVDDWQGDLDSCVFWSAIKSMDVATNTLAKTYQSGTQYGAFYSFNLASGAKVYDERDEKNIPADLLTEVKQIIDEIKSGSLDIYAGFDQYRPQ